MTLTDIIALAKQGYKPSDIKELLQLTTEQVTTPDKEPEQEERKPDPGENQPEMDASQEMPKEDDKGGKEMEYLQEIEKLKKMVSDLQSENIHKDISEQKIKSDEETVNEIYQSIIS